MGSSALAGRAGWGGFLLRASRSACNGRVQRTQDRALGFAVRRKSVKVLQPNKALVSRVKQHKFMTA